MPESNRIEYKRELTDKLENEAVAFLNSREGGAIFLGIDDKGELFGLGYIDATQLKIKDRLKNNIQPSCMGLFDVIVENHGGIDIIKIILASGPEKPYYLRKFGMTEKGCYTRIGSATEPMPQRMIEQLFAKRTRNAISKIRSNRQDLVFEQIKIYYEAKGLKLNERFATTLELLNADNDYNYVAYLLADNNSTSIKVAKYAGTDRVHLIENNEYGYCSIIKAAKAVLDKIELENKTTIKITSKERINTRLWNPIALREAIINAIVHNDFTNEIPPKFEIFSDRMEITSAGSLPDALSRDEFFEGISVPRNKELMRVFKDLDLVEHLGSGVPRILQTYSKDCFKFSENFLRMSFPAASAPVEQVAPQVAPQVTPQVEALLSVVHGDLSRTEIQEKLKLTDKKNFKENYLKPALEQDLIVMTIPDKPNSSLQKYRLTNKGKSLKDTIRNDQMPMQK
jgi:ATP-dependent DNA helicase RecG